MAFLKLTKHRRQILPGKTIKSTQVSDKYFEIIFTDNTVLLLDRPQGKIYISSEVSASSSVV